MYITSQSALNDLCANARQDGCMGVDLEFIPENTYYPQLALIQISVGEQCVLLDPLEDLDFKPLGALITDPDVVKVVHAGTQDMGILFRLAGDVPRGVFDTQIACGFMDMGHQISYAAMVGNLFDVTLKKGQSYTNWLARPLSPSQERYALDDVVYLLPAYEKIVTALAKKGRLEWMTQELDFYEDPEFYVTSDAQAYARVKKGGNLPPRETKVLKELAAWRERESRERNVPRKKIVHDQTLVELARSCPKKPGDLRGLRGPGARDVSRHSDAILSAVTRGENRPDTREAKPARLSAEEKSTGEFLWFCFRAFCTQKGIAPAYVASRDDVERLVVNPEAENKLLSGWRKEAIGDSLLSCLRGEVAVRIDPKTGELLFD